MPRTSSTPHEKIPLHLLMAISQAGCHTARTPSRIKRPPVLDDWGSPTPIEEGLKETMRLSSKHGARSTASSADNEHAGLRITSSPFSERDTCVRTPTPSRYEVPSKSTLPPVSARRPSFRRHRPVAVALCTPQGSTTGTRSGASTPTKLTLGFSPKAPATPRSASQLRPARRRTTWTPAELSEPFEKPEFTAPSPVPGQRQAPQALEDLNEKAEPITPSTAAVSPATSSTARVSLGSCSSHPRTPTDVQDPLNGLDWKRGEKIGHGSYGCVYKGLDRTTGRIFALKEAAVMIHCEEDRRHLEMLQHELDICKHLRHPNIVSYLGHQYDDGNLRIFLEYAPGGSIAGVLAEFGPFEGQLLVRSTRGLVEGLNYLHSQSPPVVHRDIKGANVLVDLNFNVKLADFGCSKRDFNTRSFRTVGSVPWMAPEVMLHADGHGRKADIWSLGCTAIEMATAAKPWGNGTFDNMMYAIRHIGMSNVTPPIPEGTLCASGQDFIRRCVLRAPDQRPSVAELLMHDFL